MIMSESALYLTVMTKITSSSLFIGTKIPSALIISLRTAADIT